MDNYVTKYSKNYTRVDVTKFTMDVFFELINEEANQGNDFITVVDHQLLPQDLRRKIAYFRKQKR